MVQPKLRVPFVIAYSGELVSTPIGFVKRSIGGVRLSYRLSQRGDVVSGVLRARCLQTRAGLPQWRLLNTRRQWAAMERLLCQVCGEPAPDDDGRIPWIMTATAFREIDETSGLTSAPPTCRTCIPEALDSCPRLGISSAVYTAGRSHVAAVLADMYTPGPRCGAGLYQAVPTGEHNVEVSFSRADLLPYALATQLIVQVDDLQPAAPYPPETRRS